MYAITGTTGHVGGAAARTLQEKGLPVRRVVRNAARATGQDAGTETVVADLGDRDALTDAFRDSDGAFVLLPTLPSGSDTEHRRIADTIAAAVDASGVPHVVALSSWGADRADGTGPIRWLNHLEHALTGTRAVVTAVRAPHFQEKVETTLDAATGAGIHPVFAPSADVDAAMVATCDIGAVVAAALAAPPKSSEIVQLDAPHYSERDVARRLGARLNRDLDVVVLPRETWEPTLIDAGLSPTLAAEIAALYDADARGLLQPAGDRVHRCHTELDSTLAGLIALV